LAYLPGRDSLPLDYTTLPGRTQDLTPKFFLIKDFGQPVLSGADFEAVRIGFFPFEFLDNLDFFCARQIFLE